MTHSEKNYIGSSVIIFIGLVICLAYSFFYWSGGYGFGIDFRNVYIKGAQIPAGHYLDTLGWIFSTFTLFNLHFGVLLTSLLISISLFLFLYHFTIGSNRSLFNFFLMYISFIILLHTWPIIMSASNGMRQGVMMAFLFLSLCYIKLSDYKLSIVMLFLAFFSHNSSVFFVGIACFSYLLTSRIYSKNIITLSVISLLLIEFVALSLLPLHDSRVIAGDFRLPFILINLTMVVLIFKYKKLDFIYLFCLVLNLYSLPLVLFGFNWEYERINQVFLIFNMFVFSQMFIQRQQQFVFFALSFFLFILTIYTGMFSALK